MINFLIFIFFFYIFFISTIGYGILFRNFCFGKLHSLKHENSIYIGFYGLLFITAISTFTSLFFPQNFLHNGIIHLFGFSYFIFSKIKNKKAYLNLIILISICVFVGLLISKTNDDFSYYHLPFTKYLTENKIIFGMGNLNHGYNLLSSLFFYNSTLYLPIINYFSFHFGLLYFLIFFNFFVFQEILSSKNHEITKFLYIFAFTFFNVSFNRVAEYGTDKPGQILIVILIIKLLQIICFDLKKDKTEKILFLIPILAYCITLKTYFLPYIILGLLIFTLNYKIKFILKNIFVSKSFAVFISFLAIYFFHHFISTGCIISPLPVTCFGDYFSWARSDVDMINLSIWLEQWSKAGAGPNFRVDNVSEYIKDFNWLSNWIQKYFVIKFLDQLAILFTSYVVVFLLFKKLKFKKKKLNLNSNFYIFYTLIFLIFFIWFYNHPTLRYGGYAIVFLTLSISISILFNKLQNRKMVKVNFKYLILIVLIIFNLKNISRIDKEFDREDVFKFSSFPFYAIKEKTYKTYEFSSGFNIFYAHHCWFTPSPCGYVDDKIYIEKKNGYFFINRFK